MSINDVLLPKYVSDSCYATLTQIYIDIFQVTQSSNLSLSNKYKKRMTTEQKVILFDKPEKLNHVVDFCKSS